MNHTTESPTTSAGDQLLTSGEAAAQFGVTNVTVKRWADAGLLPGFRTPGNHYRFKQSDVDALKAKSQA